jgi:toxin HigB-1
LATEDEVGETAVKVEYASKDLELIATDARADSGYPQAVVKIFRRRMQLIEAAIDERDFYALKSLHYEKLKGKRDHQRSMRINDQWRLVIEIKKAEPKNVVRIIEIEDYH